MDFIRQTIKAAYGEIAHLRRNWKANHLYHGGFSSLIRCEMGNLGLLGRKEEHAIRADCLDLVTFSIVPSLTLLWLASIAKMDFDIEKNIIIGDCSGGLRIRKTNFSDRTVSIPFPNYAHGQKLDMFLKKVCSSEFVLISDDDVFFLDALPVTWALTQMKADSNLAVVSFVPRARFVWNLNGKEFIPMGSYCLLLRREVWLKEKMSFRTVHEKSINPKSYKGEYDTADFANLELLRRGYDVLIAPESIREHINVFKGLSGTMWEMQSDPLGFIDHPRRPPGNAYTNLRIIHAIREMTQVMCPAGSIDSFAWKKLLKQTIYDLEVMLAPEIIEEIKNNCESQIETFRTALGF